jgi:hypothetical protein
MAGLRTADSAGPAGDLEAGQARATPGKCLSVQRVVQHHAHVFVLHQAAVAYEVLAMVMPGEVDDQLPQFVGGDPPGGIEGPAVAGTVLVRRKAC